MYKAKRSSIVLFILCLLTISGILNLCIAQKDQKLDSLFSELQRSINDTSKVNTLNAMSNRLCNISQHTEAKKYAEDALFLAEKIHYYIGIADSYNNIGCVYKNQGNFSEALENHLASLKIKDELGDKKGVSISYNNIGIIYFDQAKYPEALKNHLASLKIKEELGDKKEVSKSYNHLGAIYFKQSNYPEALKYFLASLRIREDTGDKKGISASYNNLGSIYFQLGNYPEALKYYLASLRIKEEIEDKEGIAFSYNNIGLVYFQQSNYPEALKYYLASLKIREEIHDKKGMASTYNNIGGFYLFQGNYPEALKYYLTSLKIREEIHDKSGIALASNHIGAIYLMLENYPEALKYSLISLQIFEEIGDKQGTADSYIVIGELNIKMAKLNEAKLNLYNGVSLHKNIGHKRGLINAYRALTKLDSAMGNDQEALEHYKLYTLYKDSLLNESNSKTIAEMKTKYETEKKNIEIQNLESEKLISNLKLNVQQEALIRIKLEKEKILTENLFNLQQVNLLANEKRLQELEIEKNAVELAIQKVESDRKQDQIILLNKEGEIQKLEIKKQSLFKNYLLGGMALLGVLTFIAYNNYSTRQKLKLQTLRNKIASDLHDDVGSTLSSISIFSELAQQQSKEVIPLLDTIGESSRKMLDAMADIVWTINPENDQFEKIILRMRNFAYELLGAKNIDFEFIADENISKIKLPMEVRKNLYLIFKEATNNMVKYSYADKAKFEIRNESDHLNLMIHDNGKGFDITNSTEGNGLKNMKKRAQEIGAKLSIDSYPGSGTTIQLKIAV